MADQRHLGALRILFSNRTPLLPLEGILKRMKIAGVTQHHRAQANTNPGFVHHMEHGSQALVGRANQIPDRPRCLTKVQHGRRRATVSHFVNQASQGDIIALA